MRRWLLFALAGTQAAHGAAFDVVGRWPNFQRGPAGAVAVQGAYAYVTGPGFQVIDISNANSPQWVGGVDLSGDGFGVVISGTNAVVANGSAGLAVLDISTPTNPRLLSTVLDIYADAVALEGPYAYVADETSGLRILDVTNPSHLSPVGHFSTALSAVGVSVAGHYAYLATWTQTENSQKSAVEVVDVSDPAKPQHVVSVPVPGEPWRVALAGNYAYVTGFGTGLQVLDISTPMLARLIGGASFGDWSRGVQVDANVVYVVTYFGSDADSLHVFDVSAPSQPRLLGGYKTKQAAIGLTIANHLAYVAGDAGLDLIDVSNPAKPSAIGAVDLNGESQSVAVDGNYAYLADGFAGLQVIDISDAANPRRVAHEPTTDGAVGVAVTNGLAYVAASNAGLQVIDISDPIHPHWISSYDSTANGVALIGHYACILSDSVQVVDVSDPTKLRAVSSYAGAGYIGSFAVSGRRLFLGHLNQGWEIVDLTNPAAPTRIAAQTNSDFFVNGVAANGQYLYVAEGSELKVMDLSDPRAPITVGHYQADADLGTLSLEGNYAFLTEVAGESWWSDAFVLDVSDPARPTLVARFSGVHGGSSTPNAILSRNNLLLGVHGAAGLSIRQLPGPLSILREPQDQRVTFGEEAQVSVAVYGNSPLQYTWYAGASGDTSKPVANGNGPTLPLPSLWESASYWVRVSNSSGHLDSQAISVNPVQALQTAQRGSWPGFPRGTAVDVALSGRYVYVALGDAGLEILDVSEPDNPVRVGGYQTPDSARAVVLNDHFAYVAETEGVLEVIDVSDPSNPIPRGHLMIDQANAWSLGLAVDGNHVYMAEGEAGLQVIDVSNPSQPTLASQFDTVNVAAGVAVRGNYAYVVGYLSDQGINTASAFEIVDIRDPAHPLRVSRIPLDSYAVGVTLSGTYALVANAYSGLQIIDVSDPVHPVPLGRYDTENYATRVSVHGDHTFVSDGKDVAVVDIADPAHPNLATAYQMDGDVGYANSVVLDGNLAYVAGYRGLLTLDVTDASHPVRKGYYETYGAAQGVALLDHFACLADGSYLRVLDVSDSAQPAQIARLPIDGPIDGVTLAGPYAYLRPASGGLRIVDLRNPANPTQVGNYSSNGSVFDFVATDGVRAYLAASFDRIEALDVTDPAAPKRLGTFPTTDEIKGLAVSGQHVLAVVGGRVRIMDFQDPAAPRDAAIYPDPAQDSCAGVTRMRVNGTHAFIDLDGYCRIAPTHPRLDILDVSQPAHPNLISSFDTTASLLNVSEGRAYLTSNGTNIDVLDVTVPAAPAWVATVAGASAVSDVAAAGNHLFIAAGRDGLLTVDLAPKLLVATPLQNANSLLLRWTGGAGIKLQKAPTLRNAVWSDLTGSDGQSRMELPRPTTPLFFRAAQR